MNYPYPTKESIELGFKLADAGEIAGNPLFEAVEEAKLQKETFGQMRAFLILVRTSHEVMCHSPMARDCGTQMDLMAAFLAKMFVAGWLAGRQEIIDQELKRVKIDGV